MEMAFTEDKNRLFENLDNFKVVTGFDVAGVVFSPAGVPSVFGDPSIIQRYVSHVGAELELDKLALLNLGEEVNQRFNELSKLLGMKTDLLKLTDTSAEAQARSKESSLEFMNMLDTSKISHMADLVTSVEMLCSKFDADTLFVFATERNELSRFYPWPQYVPEFLKLFHKYKNREVSRSKNLDVGKLQTPGSSGDDDSELLRLVNCYIQAVEEGI